MCNFGVSQIYYALTLGNNTLKVIRSDNNKIVVQAKGLHFDTKSELSAINKKIIVNQGT